MRVILSYIGLYLILGITSPQAPDYPKQPKGTNGPIRQ